VADLRSRLGRVAAARLGELAGPIARLCVNVYFVSAGGLLFKASQTLGLKEGRSGRTTSRRRIISLCQGGGGLGQRPESGGWAVSDVASEGTDFVGKATTGLATTGRQIVPTKVAVEIGEAATVQT
jgi:hypothetical protein